MQGFCEMQVNEKLILKILNMQVKGNAQEGDQ